MPIQMLLSTGSKILFIIQTADMVSKPLARAPAVTSIDQLTGPYMWFSNELGEF